MATVSTIPAREEGIELKLSGLKITKDLRIIYLPDGTCDFLVDGSDLYVVQFDDRKVFGVSFATLRKGNNLFPRHSHHQTKAHIFSEAAVVRLLHGEDVKTGPIVIPPPKGPPK